MRLVERVRGERFDGVPELLDRLVRVSVGPHTRLEVHELLGEHLGLLLAHGLPESVGLTGGVVRQFLGDTHDLLLVHDQTVGVLQDLPERLLQLGVDRGDRLTAVLPVRVVPVRVHSHRPRTVERESGDDVVEAGGLHPFQQLTHATGVELEHPEGVATGEQLVGLLIVRGQCLEVDVDPPVGLDVLDAVADDGEVAQTQEVHLQQPDGLAGGVGPAGDDRAVLGAFPHRDAVEQRDTRHDHGAGVDAGLADDALETACGVVDGAHVGVVLDEGAHLLRLPVALVRGIHDPGQRDVLGLLRRRQGLGDAVCDLVAGLAELHACGVLQRLLGLHRSEGDHLGDLVLAPLVRCVADHLAPAAVVEVDVDVGGGGAFRVEEPLEEQVVFDGVDVRDRQGVGDERAGG